MTDSDKQHIAWLTNNNEQAAKFLLIWRAYVHGIDDIIDGEITTPEGILNVFMMARFVYTNRFFLEHEQALGQIAINCTNAYADSVAWEKSEVDWQRNFSDHYRHFAAEMVLAIAQICGGYLHMREVSKRLRVICWKEHHDKKGNAV